MIKQMLTILFISPTLSKTLGIGGAELTALLTAIDCILTAQYVSELMLDW